MIPAAFDYHAPTTIGEATALLARLGRRGLMTPEQVRTYEADALVDTGAVRMVVPPQVATRLGSGFEASGWPSTPMDARRPSA